MKNGGKIILDLCGGTGSWSKPYKNAGYDVRLITLPDHDVRSYEPPENVYGILAAPPCTEFSLAKNGAHRKRDFSAGMEIVQRVMQIIWQCRLNGSLKFWALENPTGYLRQFLGRPCFTFEQWQFGEKIVKRTDIWGYFNNPVPLVKKRPDDMVVRNPSGRTNSRDFSIPKCPPEYRHLKLDRAALRAITPRGFAKAFFEKNQ
ncbi:MAG: hypothetical protein LBI04_00855 [Treponema sp.]|jgi:hypothetical protein|nr:hypothetical protein [Treponema sp.]